MIKIDIFRTLIGFIGCFTIIAIVYYIYHFYKNKIKFTALKYIGTKSLRLYAISSIVFEFILPYITSNFLTINYFYTIIEIIVIISSCLVIDSLLNKNKITKILF